MPARRNANRLSVAIAATVAIAAVAEPVLADPAFQPVAPILRQQDPNTIVKGYPCPKSAAILNTGPPPVGWEGYADGFKMPFFSAAVQSNNAATDYLVCNYGGKGQYAIAKTVPKAACSLNATANGFTCK